MTPQDIARSMLQGEPVHLPVRITALTYRPTDEANARKERWPVELVVSIEVLGAEPQYLVGIPIQLLRDCNATARPSRQG